MLPAIDRDVIIETALGVDQAQVKVAAVLNNRFKARALDTDGPWSVSSIGSRAMFRAFGLLGPSAHRRLPLLVRVRADSNEDLTSSVRVVLTNDEGYYAVRLPAVVTAYQRAYDEIMDDLRAALAER